MLFFHVRYSYGNRVTSGEMGGVLSELIMDLYIQNTDLFQILTVELPSYAPTWSGDKYALEDIEFPLVSQVLFARFYEGYRSIVISSGHSRGDYGQTVRLYAIGQYHEPDMASISTPGRVPEHLISEGLPFTPSAMTGEYRYKRTGDSRVADRPCVEERFFFDYQPGYQPSSFADLSGSLGALRYLSAIMHKLSEFKVVLLETGIYVKLRAYVVDGAKPPFQMGR